MIDLNDYYYFVHVVEKKGFSAAGQALGVPTSRLSRHIVQLEQRLQVTLIQRTSRQFHITDAGQLFYRHARSMISEMEEAEAAIKMATESLSGSASISCSVGVAQFALQGLLSRFLHENLKITVSQHVSNTPVNLLETGVDMVIRGHMDTLPDSDLIQRPLALVEWWLFASPVHIEQWGAPATPADLLKRRTLKVGWQSTNAVWTLRQADASEVALPFTPTLCSDDMSTLKQAAKDNLGIVALPAYACKEELTAGQLVRILPDWTAGSAQLSLLTAGRTSLSAPARLLKDYLISHLSEYVAV
ncbi:MAG: LysR family transcriptional regulator [Alteromonadaceae bacterium TMED7]|nr:LysR family transcriptional regulator [Alteromonadaceae bacterium]RPH22627.1 MAG: LysR family transcriptional regulator [Alteromonadaceae bacterium TMED7]|tara:strand:+ start:10679 stop:11584 length:906 start_codon:yes stop_codon:yes gene_type:complete